MSLLAALVLAAAAAADLPAYTPDANASRDAVPEVYRWKLGVLFPDAAAWEAEYARVSDRFDELAACEGTLAQPRQLQACLDLYFELHNASNRLSLYAGLSEATDDSDPRVADMSQRGQALVKDLGARSGFVRTEVMAIPDKKMEKAYKKVAGLQTYRVYLDEMRRRRTRVLSPDAERVLALMGDNLWAAIDLNELEAAPEKAFKSMLTDMDLPVVHDEEGNEVQLTLALYGKLRTSPDREVRREAVEGLFAALRKYQHVFAATLAGQAELDVNLARARGYDTAMAAYLDKDDIDPAVYENLVRTVGGRTDSLHRYVTLRKTVLGLDELRLHDMYIPLVEGEPREYTFAEARQTVEAALAPLGPEYVAVLHEGMDPANGWMDVYPHQGKSPGAFCAATYGVHPFVLLNQFDGYEDMGTLAHEFGHALHSYLSMQHQPVSHWTYVNFIAETASTTNETLLLDHLLAETKDEDERILLLTERLDAIKGTIYRQTQFAEFEWRVHQFVEHGTPITAELLDETYRDLVEKYYGSDYTLGADDGMEWAYIRHFYYKYYLYSYATGLSSGIALARRIRDGGEAERAAYLAMLQSGSSAPPLELMKRAGVDMSDPAPVVAALDLFDETLAELEVLLEMRAAKQRVLESGQ